MSSKQWNMTSLDFISAQSFVGAGSIYGSL